jgi:hypothetical protein
MQPDWTPCKSPEHIKWLELALHVVAGERARAAINTANEYVGEQAPAHTDTEIACCRTVEVNPSTDGAVTALLADDGSVYKSWSASASDIEEGIVFSLATLSQGLNLPHEYGPK